MASPVGGYRTWTGGSGRQGPWTPPRSTPPTRSPATATASSARSPTSSTSTATRSVARCASTEPSLAGFVTGPWGERLIRGWDEEWFDLPLTLGDELGRVALGAAAGQVAVGDSTTVLLYKAMRAAVAARPGRTEIVLHRDEFPTDRYVADGVARECGLTLRWIETDPAAGVTPEQVAAVVGEQTALVSLSHVAYRSAWLADAAAITRIAQDGGRAGAVGPVALGRLGPGRARRLGRRPRGRVHLQVPQRRARARRPTSTSRRATTTSWCSRSRGGWVRPTRS